MAGSIGVLKQTQTTDQLLTVADWAISEMELGPKATGFTS